MRHLEFVQKQQLPEAVQVVLNKMLTSTDGDVYEVVETEEGRWIAIDHGADYQLVQIHHDNISVFALEM